MVRVIYDFTPTEKYDFEDGLDALQVKEGDVVDIIKQESDWTLVSLKNKKGFVPTNYLEEKQQMKVLDLPVKSSKVEPIKDSKKEKKSEEKKGNSEKTSSHSNLNNPFKKAEKTPSTGSVTWRKGLKAYDNLKKLDPVQKTKYLQDCAAIVNSEVIYATVVQYFKGIENVWTFLLETDSKDGVHRIIYRTYMDFYDLQLTLLATFPKESGISTGNRIIPSIPGPVPIVNENITQRRAAEFAVYCKEIFDQMPDNIRNCKVLQDFFLFWESDDVYNKKYGVKEGTVASEIVAPWNQIKVGSGLNVSDPIKSRKLLQNAPIDKSKDVQKDPKTEIKSDKPSGDAKLDKPREKRKEDPNELKAPTTYQPKLQKTTETKERKKSDAIATSDEQIAEPVASPIKFEQKSTGKVFVMMLNNSDLKDAHSKLITKLNTKTVKLSYLDGTDVIEINDEDDWQALLSLSPRPKITVK
eukprot:NODE_974_length_2661_cov_0.438720.p1 type:complete len:468 gc:universal NODE_974_length_2661_cov_0.438720:2518-1115(-)